MKFSALKSSVLHQFAAPGGCRTSFLFLGTPGGGKSACAREIAEALAAARNIPASRIIEFNPSLREPTDLLGLPDLRGDCVHWVPPEEFWTIRQGTGPAVLILEELTDAGMDLQNPLCRVILDRCAGSLPLTDELYILATGNRTSDRSGANRLSTKLANRLRILTFEEDLEDWCTWADTHGIDPVLKAFLRFRPGLLSDFDPAHECNPTPRSWEDVSRIPTDMAPADYAAHAAGCVGEGAAAEWLAFRRVRDQLPDFSAILAAPAETPLPARADVLYALTELLAGQVTEDTFAAAWTYVSRLRPDYQMVFVVAVAHRCEWCYETQAFADFAARQTAAMTGQTVSAEGAS